ncbi:MAG: WGR domain-containing protein, partial [Pirellulales bacterium]|nr:WGR domain-containing protein [Pirellulales bacterium]
MSTRQLVFSDGSSDKFWNIELDDCSHTVTFGRQGTGGQSKTKQFDDAAAAQKSFDKLVQQKLSKGYVDAGGKSGAKSSAASGKSTADKSAKSKGTAKAAGKPESKQPAVDVETDVTHQIDLTPQDWLIAGFRKREPLARGEPGEADLEGLAKRLEKLKPSQYGWYIPYEKLKLAPALPSQEAHFLFFAMTGERARLETQTKLKQYFRSIFEAGEFTGKQSLQQAIGRIQACEFDPHQDIMLPLSNLLSAEDCLEVALHPFDHSKRSYGGAELAFTLCD